ncbi:MAG: site-specific DNA-methyltransferase, partial [Campylobacterota bacterium]|nr:site-specific DNA-methyltransferase [Campylobacterota bacterium]
EELQKKLWEKKKFIIETNYCITLDKIDEEHYEQILACDEQLAEWKELFDVDVQSVEDLKEEKYLVLDTKFFDVKFKYKLLSEFDNLDEDIDGVLINSENFGALNLLQDRYKEQVKTVYIDPPYNTGNDGFLYNDTYQHSSWMSFMYDRLAYSKELMTNDGIIFSSIDEYEIKSLMNIKNDIFGENNSFGNMVWQHSIQGKGYEGKISLHHNYISVYGKLTSKIGMLKRTEEDNKNYSNPDNDPNGLWRTGDVRNALDRPNLKYNITTPSGLIIKHPDNGWRWSKETLDEKISTGEIKFSEDETRIIRKIYLKNQLGRVPESFLDGKKFGTTRDANSEIKSLFHNVVFGTPKPSILINKLIQIGANNNSVILDYFAGSGTTGHAVINLNREDKGKRKYILVEMGEYFDTVTKPRIQKVIYSDSWKDGKPTTKNGISQIFKYFKLESYEDTLNNLEFNRTKEQEDTLALYPEAKDDYILNYSLDVESQDSLLNIDTFSTPFDYKLKIATSSVGETKNTAIDLVETFNYLLGLVVETLKLDNGFLTIKGENLKKSKILIIWRDNKSSDELDSFVKDIDFDAFDEVYVNGDSHLEKVKLIEQEFKKLMFGE